LAGYEFTIVYYPGNLNDKPDMLARRPERCCDRVYSSENSLQPIALGLKPEYFVSEMMLENFRVRTGISGSKRHSVPPIQFDTNLLKHVVLAAADHPASQEAYNGAKNGNPCLNVKYFYGGLYLWIPTKDDWRKMIYSVEHDSKGSGQIVRK
jgi:hypothetical protein